MVASVSCIYGMGNPEEYRGQLLELHTGVDYDQRSILRRLVDLQYDRNDMTLGRGKFRVRGDTIEVHPAYEETVLRIEMFGDTVDRLTVVDPLTGEQLREHTEILCSRPRTTSPATSACRRPWWASRPSCRSGSRCSRRKASCSKRSGCACARSTTSR